MAITQVRPNQRDVVHAERHGTAGQYTATVTAPGATSYKIRAAIANITVEAGQQRRHDRHGPPRRRWTG